MRQTILHVLPPVLRQTILHVLPPVLRRANPFRSAGLILMYHRVSELPSDPQLLAVTPQRFAEHLQILCGHTHPVSLVELADGLRARKLPGHIVAVSFDDGYADNLDNAKPLLERYKVPASVFITTGHIGSRREFWWDELERLLLQPGTLPATLELPLAGDVWRWELGQGATYAGTDYEHYRAWHIEQANDPTARHSLYRALYGRLHSLRESDREPFLEALRQWAGVEPIGRTSHRTLSRSEVLDLAGGEWVEVGAHTVSHPPLAALPLDAQRAEILDSKSCLEELLHRSVSSFAYPHGSYAPQTLALVREAGFTCACSSDTATVQRGSDVFRLPRVGVRNWDGNTFARLLKAWFRRS